MADTSSDEFLKNYTDYLDGDFTIEHQEGTNRDRILTPIEAKALIELKREQEAMAARASGVGMFRRVVD